MNLLLSANFIQPKLRLLDCLTRLTFAACVMPLQDYEALTDSEDDCDAVEGGLTPVEAVSGKMCALNLHEGLLVKPVHDQDCDQMDSCKVHNVWASCLHLGESEAPLLYARRTRL